MFRRKVIAGVVCALVGLPLASHTAETDGLLLALSFDEGAGAVAKDSSPNHFDGKVQATWGAGKFGKAVKLNGTDNIVLVPDQPKLRFADTNACTLMAWVNVEGQGASVWPRVMARETATGSNGGFHMPLDWAAGIKVRIVIDGSAGQTSAEPMKLNTWHHATVTCDGAKSRVYLDGKMVFEGAQEKPFPDIKADLGIGNSPVGQRPLMGLIDEVRIWNRPLAEDEIKSQMTLGTTQFLSVDPRSKLAATWGGIKSGS